MLREGNIVYLLVKKSSKVAGNYDGNNGREFVTAACYDKRQHYRILKAAKRCQILKTIDVSETLILKYQIAYVMDVLVSSGNKSLTISGFSHKLENRLASEL